jgi:hypothetical protein
LFCPGLWTRPHGVGLPVAGRGAFGSMDQVCSAVRTKEMPTSFWEICTRAGEKGGKNGLLAGVMGWGVRTISQLAGAGGGILTSPDWSFLHSGAKRREGEGKGLLHCLSRELMQEGKGMQRL